MGNVRTMHTLVTGASGEGKSFFTNVLHYDFPGISVYFNGERKPHDEIWGPVCKRTDRLDRAIIESGDSKVEFYPPTSSENQQAELLREVISFMKWLGRKSNSSRQDKKLQVCIGGAQKFKDVVKQAATELDGFGVRVGAESQHEKAVGSEARDQFRVRVLFPYGEMGRAYLKGTQYGYGPERAQWIFDWWQNSPRYSFVTKHPDRDPVWQRHTPLDPSQLPPAIKSA